ncbi:MAG: MoaD/ThiS family protein [Candidatus Hydrothermarchaeales archaeon]
MTMEITVRHKDKKKVKIEEGLLIEDLLRKLKINRETVLVAKNGGISLEEEVLKDGDIIDIISVISGG